jgi:hypothetical protein
MQALAPELSVAAAIAVGIPAYAWWVRGRTYATFAGVVLLLSLPAALVLHARLLETVPAEARPAHPSMSRPHPRRTLGIDFPAAFDTIQVVNHVHARILVLAGCDRDVGHRGIALGVKLVNRNNQILRGEIGALPQMAKNSRPHRGFARAGVVGRAASRDRQHRQRDTNPREIA